MGRTTRGTTIAIACALAQAGTAQAALPKTPSSLVNSLAAKVQQSKPQEPLTGTPALLPFLTQRAQQTLDPRYWLDITHRLVATQNVLLPQPVDVVKPEAILPVAPIAASDAPTPLPHAPRDLGHVAFTYQGARKTLDDYLRTSETDAVAVLQDGKVLTALYSNGWSAETRHQPWSVTKSFVSALIGIAVGEGKVRSIDEPIDAYIRELSSTAWRGTTIRNLLRMESGVHWDEGTPVLAVNTQVQQWVQMWLDLATEGALGQTRNEFLKSLPRVAPQGTRFSYNSGNTQVLAWLLETVYGKPFNQIIESKLWQPAGMAGDAQVMTDRLGDAVASQGLYSRLFDLARFGELFRNGGRTPAGRQVVPESWVRYSTTPTVNSRGVYASQWWSGATPGSYEASGFQGQKITVDPSGCTTVVRLGHALGGRLRDHGSDPADPGSYGFRIDTGDEEFNELFKALRAELGAC